MPDDVGLNLYFPLFACARPVPAGYRRHSRIVVPTDADRRDGRLRGLRAPRKMWWSRNCSAGFETVPPVFKTGMGCRLWVRERFGCLLPFDRFSAAWNTRPWSAAGAFPIAAPPRPSCLVAVVPPACSAPSAPAAGHGVLEEGFSRQAGRARGTASGAYRASSGRAAAENLGARREHAGTSCPARASAVGLFSGFLEVSGCLSPATAGLAGWGGGSSSLH